jgi:hypothetical protein
MEAGKVMIWIAVAWGVLVLIILGFFDGARKASGPDQG